MTTYAWCLFIVIAIATSCLGTEHGLEEGIDQLIRDELGDDPFSRRLRPEDFKKFDELNINVTKIENETDDQLKINRTEVLLEVKKLELERLLNLKTNRLEEFKNNVDVFDQLFQKLKKHEPIINGRRASDDNNLLLETMLVDAEDLMQNLAPNVPLNGSRGTLGQKSDLRSRWYYTRDVLLYYMPWSVHWRMSMKINNMMYTHLYRAQYYITFAQYMRKRYVHHVRYKLGFCFALARQLYQEQKNLLNGLWYNYKGNYRLAGNQLSWALFTYEKVQKLQRDIRDINHHIKALEYERKMTEDPDYYKYLPSSTGRYSG